MQSIRFSTPALLAVLALPVGSAAAQPTIDGVLDADFYGSAVAVQQVQTQFGDKSDTGGGSELDAAYAQISGDTLYLMLTGTLENNFNKLLLFVDSVPGGQNTLDETNNPANFDSRIGGGFTNGWDPLNDLTFDDGFDADYAFLVRHGAGTFDVDFSPIGTSAPVADEFADIFFGLEEGASGPLFGANSGQTFEFGFDDSNTAGVASGTQQADQAAALAVNTGTEFAIPLAALGNPTGPIKVTAAINGSNNDFLSNQFLGALQPIDGDNDPETPLDQANLGSDGMSNFLETGLDGVDLGNFAGDQFFVIGDTPPGLRGDFDDNGVLEAADIVALQGNFGDAAFDLTGDGDASQADVVEWITAADIYNSFQGDATLDGNVNLADFAVLGQNFGATSGKDYTTGDFTSDGAVNLADFAVLGQNFGNTGGGPAGDASTAGDAAVASDLTLVIDPTTGEVTLDVDGDTLEITGFEIASESGVLNAAAFEQLQGLVGISAASDENINGAAFPIGSSITITDGQSLGLIAKAGADFADVLFRFTDTNFVQLDAAVRVVPEPASAAALLALGGFALRRRSR